MILVLKEAGAQKPEPSSVRIASYMERDTKMTTNLSLKQWAFCVSYGLALWLGACLLVRMMGPMGVLSGWGLVISFALLIPGTLPAVILTKQVVGPFKDQLLVGVSIISAIALLLAGIGFSFLPGLYGPDPAQVVAASGFIMWGGGIGLVFGVLMGKDR
jgi:hypothetical protein